MKSVVICELKVTTLVLALTQVIEKVGYSESVPIYCVTLKHSKTNHEFQETWQYLRDVTSEGEQRHVTQATSRKSRHPYLKFTKGHFDGVV